LPRHGDVVCAASKKKSAYGEVITRDLRLVAAARLFNPPATPMVPKRKDPETP
jgi:hypothetical protein